MGTRRRESKSRLLLRITKAIEDRDTLLYCRACGGDGLELLETATGYRKIPCKWCEDGFVDKVSASLYVRWLRIKAINCPDPSV